MFHRYGEPLTSPCSPASGCLKHALGEVGPDCDTAYYDKINAYQIVKDFGEDHHYDAKDEGNYSNDQSCHELSPPRIAEDNDNKTIGSRE
jgi:hypothetical protein